MQDRADWIDIRQGGEYSIMQPWFWPKGYYQNPAWNQRLGRVVHWITVSIAIVAAVITAWATIQMRSNVSAYNADLAAWNARHVVIPAIGSPNTAPAAANVAGDAYYESDPKPYEPMSPLIAFLIGAPIAFGIALAGRAFRYIVGGE